MMSLKSFVTASATLTLFSIVGANQLDLLVRTDDGTVLPSCPSYQNFNYAGCYADTSTPRSLPFSDPSSTNNVTVEQCISFCKGNNYRYAGLEYYGQCFCGDSVSSAQLDESQCNYPCAGNSSEICGGSDILSVYYDPSFTYPVDTSTVSDYSMAGCYSDSSSQGRTLVYSQDQIASANMTVELCLSACKAGAYPLAGVEFGSQCYCGAILGNGTSLVDSSQCSMPCKGNGSETCGGAATLNLWVAEDLESSKPCYAGPSGPVSSSPSSSGSAASSTTSSSSTSTLSSAVVVATSTTVVLNTTASHSSVISTTSSSSAAEVSTTTVSPAVASSSSSSTTLKFSTTTSSPAVAPISSTTLKSSTTTSSHAASTTSTIPPKTSSTSSSAAVSTTTSAAPKTPLTTSSSAKVATTVKTTATSSLSMCTIISTPTPVCEYKCGSWCSSGMPWFVDSDSCLDAVATCFVQIAACFTHAGFPASLECIAYASWCENVSSYCQSSTCTGKGLCSNSDCKSKNPIPSPGPVATPVTSVFACPATTGKAAPTTTSKASTTTCVPVPTVSNVCSQPQNDWYGYGPGNAVGGIELPCLTCNNVAAEYAAGNIFKLYTATDTTQCGGYSRSSLPQGCKDACDTQYSTCMGTYAQGCNGKKQSGSQDSYAMAAFKCQLQHNDCYSVNANVNANVGSGRCSAYNWGWTDEAQSSGGGGGNGHADGGWSWWKE